MTYSFDVVPSPSDLLYDIVDTQILDDEFYNVFVSEFGLLSDIASVRFDVLTALSGSDEISKTIYPYIYIQKYCSEQNIADITKELIDEREIVIEKAWINELLDRITIESNNVNKILEIGETFDYIYNK